MADVNPEPDILLHDSALFLSAAHPDRALRRWYMGQQARMDSTIRFLRELRALVEADGDLAALVTVAGVHKTGSDWILVDFDGSALPISEATGSCWEASDRNCERLLQLLTESGDPNLRTLRTMIGEKSENVRWSFSKDKVLVTGAD